MYETKSAPAPPCSSGTHTPISPSSPIRPQELAREAVVAIPRGCVRLDLGRRELARQRLDLALLRRQLEVHGGQTIRMRLAAILLAVLALSACGDHKTSETRSPGQVVRAWSAALDRNDSEAAGTLFADGARVIQGDVQTLATHSDAVRWNAGLPCGGTITLLEPRSNGQVLAVFTLTNRPQHRCEGPGDKAAALFQVEDGKIVLWHEVDVPTLPSAGEPA